LGAVNEYMIDGDSVNKVLDTYKLEIHMLTGQVFEALEKKFLKSLADEVEKSKAQTVKFVNLESIALGPHKDFLFPICGALAELIDQLSRKGVTVTGTVRDPLTLPWNLVSRIDKSFKGIAPADGEPAKQ